MAAWLPMTSKGSPYSDTVQVPPIGLASQSRLPACTGQRCGRVRGPSPVACPVAIGLSLLAITAGAVQWLGETLTMPHVPGTVLVLAGIMLLSR